MFRTLDNIPPDPILAITNACKADPNPHKVDLGVGVYRDEAGNVPVMAAIREAANRHIAELSTYTYVTPPGDAKFLATFPLIALGENPPAYTAVQSNSGTGALHILGRLLASANPKATIWLPTPTWGNHHAVFEACGLAIKEFSYYDKANHEVTFDAMMATFATLGADDVVLLHGSCQNPVGADPTFEQWQAIGEIALQQGFTVFIDVAYQGLGAGLEEDARGMRHLARTLPNLLIAQSASKIFGVYGLRTGAAIVVSNDEENRTKAFGNLNQIARAEYSMTSSYGAELVARVLQDDVLAEQWRAELEGMGTRIRSLRQRLADGLNAQVGTDAFSFITNENGMFSFIGFSKPEMQRLRDEYSVYGLNSGRITIAGLNDANIGHVIDSVAAIAKS